jgi:hypothetical protein
MRASILQPYSRPHSLYIMVCSSHSVVIGIIQIEKEPRVKDAVEKYANVKGNCRVKMEGVVKDVVRYLRPEHCTSVSTSALRHGCQIGSVGLRVRI